MSNETQHPKTVLDMLEDCATDYASTVKETWEHSGVVCKANGTDLKRRFLVYWLACIKTFIEVIHNPMRGMNFVLGAVSRELINGMTEDEKAELATITVEELEDAKRNL